MSAFTSNPYRESIVFIVREVADAKRELRFEDYTILRESLDSLHRLERAYIAKTWLTYN